MNLHKEFRIIKTLNFFNSIKRLQSLSHRPILPNGSNLSDGCLMGVGNPLIDYLVYVDSNKNEEIIRKYKLKKNSPQIAKDVQKPIFKYMGSPSYEFGNPIITAGGATQNTIRVAQWLLSVPEATTFLGAVGKDKEAEILHKELKKCMVHNSYEILDGFETGKCIVFVSGKDRTLVVDLGASIHLSSHILDDVNVRHRFDMAKCIYLEGFLWATNPHLMIQLTKMASKTNKILATNLHAEFLVPAIIHEENNFLSHVDILFGNQYEALALAKALAIGARLKSIRDKFSEFLNFPFVSTDGLSRIALHVSQLCHVRPHASRTVVFTQGEKEVVLCLDGNRIDVIPVQKIPQSNVVDTTGCGDAFVGGFLASLLSDRSTIESVHTGIEAAQFILTQSGCYLPDNEFEHKSI